MEMKKKGDRVGHVMPLMNEGNARALKISAWLTGVYFFIELGLGIYSGSIAVLSDAFHTFSAVGGIVLAIVAGRIAMHPADKDRSYGSFRAEIVGALFNGLFLFLMAILVLYMGFRRLFNPVELPILPMLIAAFGGLVTEAISMKLLFSGQKGNLNMRGAFWHVIQTFVGSLIIIVAAVVIYFSGFVLIDSILGMLFGLVLFWASYGIIRDALNILLEGVPEGVDLVEIGRVIRGVRGVKGVHHVHAWALTSGKNIFSAHVLVGDLAKSREVLRRVQKVLKEKFGFYFVTLQLEMRCEAEGAEGIESGV